MAEMTPELAARRRFEALLGEALLQLSHAGKCTRVPSPFRERFKFCLTVLGHIEESTKELTVEQFTKLNEKMNDILNLPPPPDSQ